MNKKNKMDQFFPPSPGQTDEPKISKAFQNEKVVKEDAQNGRNIGLKINNDNSMTSKLPKKPPADEFEKKASMVNEKLNEYHARASDYALKYKHIIIDDKTLADNKGIFTRQAEMEIINNLVYLADEMNNDPHEQEGSGSIGVISLLLKITLLQRDVVNKLEYDIYKLQNDVKKLSAVISSSSPASVSQPDQKK
jgi:hypothetical protein